MMRPINRDETGEYSAVPVKPKLEQPAQQTQLQSFLSLLIRARRRPAILSDLMNCFS